MRSSSRGEIVGDGANAVAYCHYCGEGYSVKDIGIAKSCICCIDCADSMGEKLKAYGKGQV